MRNLAEYPITLDEVIECLNGLKLEAMAEAVENLSYGDMRPLLLEHAIKVIKREKFFHGG